MLLLDHEPGADEIRRIQAQANQRESLSLVDQQEQLARLLAGPRRAAASPTGSPRSAPTSASRAKRAHNLRRQLTLPDPIRARVAERPTGEQISVTMANRLADMHEIAPQLTEAVAKRITSTDLHDKALQDLGAFVHRTVVEDEHTYAVRIDDGAHARRRTSRSSTPARTSTADGQRPARRDPRLRARASSTRELDTLAARAKTRGAEAPHHRRDARPRPQRPLRVRARPRAGLRRRRSGSSTPRSCSTSSTSSSATATTAPAARRGLLRRRAPRRRRAARRGRRGRAAPSAGARRATPRRPAATSGSATTSAPG